ncbi:ANTAR domain-containing protein [Kribbella albertanoniae]|uniref:ANTAR domain-containing protein n=2 Tax=Kribbella albertanoniae TaxID=1266829 RepID=A0A4R4QBC2_9ACTN|nr:ANTAR domain-containing protein [Kribbella albertanoniae]
MDLDATLARITHSAVEAIPCVDYASISITATGGGISTLAPTDRRANEADELQYKLHEGPCYAVVRGLPVVQVDDLSADTRWPEYGRQAVTEFGLGSQLSFQFHAAPNARGALNLYSSRVNGITAETRQLGCMFSRLVAIALGWAQHDEELGHALVTRQHIGQAVGILMERYQLDADHAFAFLVRVSQSGNIKLRDVADGIIDDTLGKTP